MFFLQPGHFGQFDKKKLRDFVCSWEKLYQDNINIYGYEKVIDYFSELNIDGTLSKDNVIRLLRWKDPKYLTDTICSGPNKNKENERVKRVLDSLSEISKFRNDEIKESEFLETTKRIFSSGIIWKLFLFHIARPLEYPIADQHVFRVYALHRKEAKPQSFDQYLEYKCYFDELATSFLEAVGKNDASRIERLRERKRLDNALVAFGQFLKKYTPPTR